MLLPWVLPIAFMAVFVVALWIGKTVLTFSLPHRTDKIRKVFPADKPTMRLLVPSVTRLEATDAGTGVTIRAHLLVSNENDASSTEIYGFGASLQDQLPTDRRWSIIPNFPSELTGMR
jgi:hypothetical protein